MNSVLKRLFVVFLLLSMVVPVGFSAIGEGCNTASCFLSSFFKETVSFFLNGDDLVLAGISFVSFGLLFYAMLVGALKRFHLFEGHSNAAKFVTGMVAFYGTYGMHQFLAGPNGDPRSAIPFFAGVILFAMLFGAFLWFLYTLYKKSSDVDLKKTPKILLMILLITLAFGAFVFAAGSIVEGVNKHSASNGGGFQGNVMGFFQMIIDFADRIFSFLIGVTIVALIVVGIPLLLLIMGGVYVATKWLGKRLDKSPGRVIREDMEEVDEILTRIDLRRKALSNFLKEKNDQLGSSSSNSSYGGDGGRN